jgi:hypothetical protein
MKTFALALRSIVAHYIENAPQGYFTSTPAKVKTRPHAAYRSRREHPLIGKAGGRTSAGLGQAVEKRVTTRGQSQADSGYPAGTNARPGASDAYVW